jgi:hypothetical protein
MSPLLAAAAAPDPEGVVRVSAMAMVATESVTTNRTTDRRLTQEERSVPRRGTEGEIVTVRRYDVANGGCRPR